MSTRVWADRAESVIGVEPAPDMLRIARSHTEYANVKYLGRLAHDTHLAGGGADIVTCGMSLHWMEPDSTAKEIIRLLRPGGVFAAYSYHWHTGNPQVQLAYDEFMKRIDELSGQNQPSGELKRWPKWSQENTLEASGAFCLIRQIGLHSIEYYNAQDLVEFVKTYGVVRDVLKRGLSDEESGLAAFAQVAQAEFGRDRKRLYVSWNVWVAVK